MKKVYFIILSLALGNVSSFAQTNKDSIVGLDEIIINENQFSTPISKQNRNVYVIDRATIEKLPARSVQELLQYANGVKLASRAFCIYLGIG